MEGTSMPRLRIRSIEDAPGAAQAALIAAEKNNGFLPNLLRLLANAPGALETYLTVSGINARSSLSLAEREAIQITAAATHGCGFCVAGHTAIASKKAKLDAATISALRRLRPMKDEKLNALTDFTRAVIAARGAVSDEELDKFRAAGFDDAAALEVVLGVSLATLCNFANNLGQPPLNPELEPYRWDGLPSAEANFDSVAAV
jgi:uncharacterized peroxidase-related enzyme